MMDLNLICIPNLTRIQIYFVPFRVPNMHAYFSVLSYQPPNQITVYKFFFIFFKGL